MINLLFHDALVFLRTFRERLDTVQMVLLHAQAAKDAQDEGLDLPALAPQVPWRDLAGMRDRLAHKYWYADPAIVWNVVANELWKLEEAARTLLAGKARVPRKPARKRG